MNISLTPQLERMIHQKVKTGMYQTASEVVREGLRLLGQRDRDFERLKADVLAGFDQIERGESDEYDEASLDNLVKDISRRGRARLKRSQKAPRT